MTASDGYVEGQTFMWITENNLTTKDYRLRNGLLEAILSPTNLNSAYKQVKRNRGAGGVDKMEVDSLKDYLVRHKDALISSILRSKYCPNPTRRVFISLTTATASDPDGQLTRHSKKTMKSITSYIEKKLFLRVNRDKTKVAYISNINFLGYSF